MVVTDYHRKRTMRNVQKEGTMKFPTRWLCYTSKWSCELGSCDRISTYRSRKEKKNVGQVPRNVTGLVSSTLLLALGSTIPSLVSSAVLCAILCAISCAVSCTISHAILCTISCAILCAVLCTIGCAIARRAFCTAHLGGSVMQPCAIGYATA